MFSKTQSRAIALPPGPAMILAGPGSGKTLVITNRARYLIDTLQVPQEQILVITFTKAAALEMRERFLQLSKETRARVTFGTFHAVFFQILKQAYHYTAASILREDTRYEILRELTGNARLEAEDEKELIQNLAGEISLVKNEQIPLQFYYSASCPDEVFRDIYRRYQDRVQRMGLIDFDDMLVYCYELLKERGDILAQWQKRFRHILVDEFQDINQLQYEIIKMLAAPENQLFVVGDDDQSIYRFRGSKPEIMMRFSQDYPQARVVTLAENYRSTPQIIQAAGLVIAENQKRYPKEIQAVKEGGQPVELRAFVNQETEALYLIRQIRQAREQGRSYRQMAILTRTNTGGRYLSEKLMEFQIPYHSRDQIPNLYDHWIAQDVLAYLRLGLGIRERKDFLRVCNHPKRYLSRECVDTDPVDFERLRLWYEEKPWMKRRIDELEEQLQALGGMTPYAAVNYIRCGMEYDGYLREYASYRRIRPEELLEVLEELQEHARPFRRTLDWFAHIEEYRRQLQEMHQSRRQQSQEDAVTLSTFHGAKGLEFDEVWLPDVNEEVLPHRKATLEADLEEERRLLYVGMTRARQSLHVFWVKERHGKVMESSRFLEGFSLEE